MQKYFFIVLVIGFGLEGCGQKGEKAKEKNDAVAMAVKHWETGVVVEKSLSSSVNLPGELKAFQMVQLYPRINGFVKEVLVDRGSVVKKGAVLMRLEAPEMEQQYLAAESKYLQAQSNYVGSKDQYDRLLATSHTAGTIAPRELTAAKAKMDGDNAVVSGEQSNYRAIEKMEEYLILSAPFDGVITERNVHPGALAGPNMKVEDNKPLLVLEQESKLRLVVNIPEAYSSQIDKHALIHFHVSTLPGRIFQGTVSRSAGSLNMKYRSEAVELDVENGQGLLKPGMYAEVTLPVKRTGLSLVIPKSAIVTSTERKYVVGIRDGKSIWLDVQEGNSRNDSTEVFGGLVVGDRVVLKATDELKEGVVIK